MAAKENITIYQGSTLGKILRWESSYVEYRVVTGITKAAPAVVTATAHGAPEGWRVAVTGCSGMKQINAVNMPPKATDYHKAFNVTADTLELNDVDATDFTAYVANSGILRYNRPVDLAGYTARMQIRSSITATDFLIELTTTGATIGTVTTTTPATDGIILDNTNKVIQLNLSATNTAAITWATAVYDLEVVSADGVVTRLLYGNVTLDKEITR